MPCQSTGSMYSNAQGSDHALTHPASHADQHRSPTKPLPDWPNSDVASLSDDEARRLMANRSNAELSSPWHQEVGRSHDEGNRLAETEEAVVWLVAYAPFS